MDLVGLGAKRGDILGAGGLALVTNRPVVRIGIDRSRWAAKAGRLGPRGRPARRHRRRGVRQAGDRRRATAFVEAIVYRQDEVPRGVLPGVRRVQGGAVIAGEHAAGADQGLRRADPRLGRRGHRRDDRGGPRRLPDRRHRRPVRAPGEVRRAAARHARSSPSTPSAPTAKTREAFRYDASRRPAAPADPGRATCRSPPSRLSPTSARPRRWWRSGRRPARSSPPPTAPGPGG